MANTPELSATRDSDEQPVVRGMDTDDTASEDGQQREFPETDGYPVATAEVSANDELKEAYDGISELNHCKSNF
ncbi:unnamed protein product [Dibothriocephalus latus]|uniref:Uncharacterized protein n=1 Tax=Dibothriocephalus latus TaxID=60516 RepID=A0A3P7NJL0_DIBLA|nr:unnamed protein product [Dibothriocephalus latus]